MIDPQVLKQFVEQYESLDREKAQVAESQKDVLDEVKAAGGDNAAFKKIIALRKKDPTDIELEEGLVEEYKQALGM